MELQNPGITGKNVKDSCRSLPPSGFGEVLGPNWQMRPAGEGHCTLQRRGAGLAIDR